MTDRSSDSKFLSDSIGGRWLVQSSTDPAGQPVLRIVGATGRVYQGNCASVVARGLPMSQVASILAAGHDEHYVLHLAFCAEGKDNEALEKLQSQEEGTNEAVDEESADLVLWFAMRANPRLGIALVLHQEKSDALERLERVTLRLARELEECKEQERELKSRVAEQSKIIQQLQVCARRSVPLASRVPDSAWVPSEEYGSGWVSYRGKWDKTGDNAWVVSEADKARLDAGDRTVSYLTINLQRQCRVTGILLRGRSSCGQFVSRFAMSYSNNGTTFATVQNIMDGSDEFQGCTSVAEARNESFEPFNAQYVRIAVRGYTSHPSTSLEILGVPLDA